MEQAQAIALARVALYPKGMPHPECDAVSAVFRPDSRRFIVHFPAIWWVNRATLRKLAHRCEPVPKAPGIRDPSHHVVTVECDTGRTRVVDHP